MELVRSARLHDGERMTVIGSQVSGSVQVFEELLPASEIPQPEGLTPGAAVATYVFQLTSVEVEHGELCYVFCIGAYNRNEPGWGPFSPEPGQCWVTGVLVGYGAMENASGVAVNALYFAASTVLFLPPVQASAAQPEDSS